MNKTTMGSSRFNKKIFAVGLALIIVANFLAVTTVFAAPYVPLAPLPGTTDTTVGGKPAVQDAGNYIKGAFNLAIGIAAALAIIMIIWGGIKYMTAEAITSKGDARKTITNAIYGLLLALGSYLILLTINPSLVNFNLNITPVTPATGPTTPPAATARFRITYYEAEFKLKYQQGVYVLEYTSAVNGTDYSVSFDTYNECNSRLLSVSASAIAKDCVLEPKAGTAEEEHGFLNPTSCNARMSVVRTSSNSGGLTYTITEPCTKTATGNPVTSVLTYNSCQSRASAALNSTSPYYIITENCTEAP
ncbi:MAG: hypothetical protein WC673_01955 [Candidatus Paceibacterota bacterium]